MESSATRYVKTEAGAIGYRIIGDGAPPGAPDILFLTNLATNVEVMLEEPTLRHY